MQSGENKSRQQSHFTYRAMRLKYMITQKFRHSLDTMISVIDQSLRYNGPWHGNDTKLNNVDSLTHSEDKRRQISTLWVCVGDPVSSEAEDVHRAGCCVYPIHMAHSELFLAATCHLPETPHICLQVCVCLFVYLSVFLSLSVCLSHGLSVCIVCLSVWWGYKERKVLHDALYNVLNNQLLPLTHSFSCCSLDFIPYRIFMIHS